MTVTAQEGILSFGPQSARGSLATDFYRHRATDIDLGVMDDVRLGAPEIGGIAIPTFPYKAGPVIGGGFTLQPRLEDTLGWLLYGALGAHTPTENPGASGMYDHEFILGTVPYMTFRKYIPPSDQTLATDLGEIYKDCKIVGMTLNLPNDAPLTMRVDVIGREFVEDDAAGAWSYENTMESWESIPVACVTNGFIKIGGDELPIVAARVGWQNVPLDLRQERIFGDPFILDVTPVQRVLSFDFTIKWNNPELYRQVLTGAIDGTAWTATPFTGSFEVHTLSSVDMPTESEPYSLNILGNSAMMTQVGGITLAGNQSIMMRFNGTAIESALEYAVFTLRNKATDYVWPPVS